MINEPVESDTQKTEASLTRTKPSVCCGHHTQVLQTRHWEATALKIMFCCRLLLVATLTVVFALLALGEFPLELRISGVMALSGLARQVFISPTFYFQPLINKYGTQRDGTQR